MTPHAGREAPGHRRPPLTPAQRKAIAGADPGSGEVRAGAGTLGRLVALGLVRPYGRLGAHYLTAAGHTVRDHFHGRTDLPEAGIHAAGFSPATGDDRPHTENDRAQAAARAWASLQEIRRLTGDPRDPAAVPAPWERARPGHALALALEASGTPPSALDASGRRVRNGYRVTAHDPRSGSVRVEWRTTPGPHNTPHLESRDRLDDCARILAGRGWETERYTDSRRRPFLIAAPRPLR